MNLLDNVKTKEIYAIEPDLENFNILKRTIGNGSNVKLVNAAVSNYNGKVDIWEGNGNHTTLNILGENPSLKEKGWKTKRCTVDCATIDYIFLEKLKIQLDVCKIDVEGAEFMVLEGGEKTIPKMKCLFVECHTNDTYSKIIKLCLENKWKPICLKNLYEIKSVDDLDFCYQLIIFPKE
jgi:FkbM family methyltransferase